jgi:hypothetical protein
MQTAFQTVANGFLFSVANSAFVSITVAGQLGNRTPFRFIIPSY